VFSSNAYICKDVYLFRLWISRLILTSMPVTKLSQLRAGTQEIIKTHSRVAPVRPNASTYRYARTRRVALLPGNKNATILLRCFDSGHGLLSCKYASRCLDSARDIVFLSSSTNYANYKPSRGILPALRSPAQRQASSLLHNIVLI
jgi:hypothetical protein